MNYALGIVERTIAAMEKPQTPEAVTAEPHQAIWGPLEKLLGPALCAQFMFMGSTKLAARGVRIEMYKHVDTRRYLNVSEDGRTWKFVPATSGYEPQDSKEAIKHALS